MSFNVRRLKEEDWTFLPIWWEGWAEWQAPPRNFMPENGLGGIIVEKGDKPICACFVYTTNSKVAYLEFVISDPNYKNRDKFEALEFMIIIAEKMCKDMGFEYIFSMGRNKGLINLHRRLGYNVDDNSSKEIVKKL